MKRPAKPAPFSPDHTFERWTAADLAANTQPLELCLFCDCDLTGAAMQGLRFIDCRFERCNLSMAKANAGTGFQNAAFVECKLTAFPFAVCREMLFEVSFERCRLDYASFFGKKMPKTRFDGCDLTEADFTQADLTGSAFSECNLDRALFSQTQLANADFTTATGYLIDPTFNPMKGARFSREGLPGLVAGFGVVVSE